MREVPSWDQYFLGIAQEVAKRSKDPRRQVGAVLVDPVSHAICMTGYNGMPKGMEESDEGWEPDAKKPNVCHAEENTIALCACEGVRTRGRTLYCLCLPCWKCAKLIVQAGIPRVVTLSDVVCTSHSDEVNQSLDLFNKARVEIVYQIHWAPNPAELHPAELLRQYGRAYAKTRGLEVADDYDSRCDEVLKFLNQPAHYKGVR